MGIIPEKRSRAPSPTQGAGATIMMEARKRPREHEAEQKHAGLLHLCEQALGSLRDPPVPRSSVSSAKHEVSQGSFVCQWANCSAAFNNVEALGLHISDSHIKPQKTLNRREKRRGFLCEWGECHRDKPFNSCYNLEHHVRYKHTGEKPFACPYVNCHSRFAQQSDLKEHIRLHEPNGGEPKRKKRKGDSADSSEDTSSGGSGSQISLPPIARFLLPPFRLPPIVQTEPVHHDPTSPLYPRSLPHPAAFLLHTRIAPVVGHSHPTQLQPAADFIGFPPATPAALLLPSHPTTPMPCSNVHHSLLYDLSCQSANRSTSQPAPAPGSPLYPSPRPSPPASPSSPSSQPASPSSPACKN